MTFGREDLILEVGNDYVILLSSEKICLGVLITLGLISKPVSLDGCESLAKDFFGKPNMTKVYQEYELVVENINSCMRISHSARENLISQSRFLYIVENFP